MRFKKVIAAMSGGVDSSVAAALLKEQGYEVFGVTLKMWGGDIESRTMGVARRVGGCCGINEINDAKRVADQLGIAHYTLDFRDEFKEKVIHNFIEEYKRGRTPNPCVRCNQFIKFEHLMQKARELGAEYVATGHYARVKELKDQSLNFKTSTKFQLLKGIDKRKDQAYVLYTLKQEQLAHILFPLGEMTKEEVRKLARKYDLPVAEKDESQEICFVEDNNYGRFLKENYPDAVKPGPILDLKGNIVGQHEGIAFYTIGQRKGIGAHLGEPKYVVRIDPSMNAVIIGNNNDTLGKELFAEPVTFVSGIAPLEPIEITAKIRYNCEEAKARLIIVSREQKVDNRAHVVFDRPQRSITPGQAVVFYQGEEVLGGGIIN